MDERQKRILASLVAGSALSLTLGVTASAEGLDIPEDPNSAASQTLDGGNLQPMSGAGNDANANNNTN